MMRCLKIILILTLALLPEVIISSAEAREFVVIKSNASQLVEGESAILSYTLYSTKPNREVDVLKGRSFWSVEGEFLPVPRQVVDRPMVINGQRYFSRHIASIKVTLSQAGDWFISPAKIFIEKLSTERLFDAGLPTMETVLHRIGKTERYELEVLPLRFEVTPKEMPLSIQPDKVLAGEDIDVLFEREKQAEADRKTTAITLAILFAIGVTGGTTVRKLMKNHNPAIVYLGELSRYLMSSVNKDTRFIPKREAHYLHHLFHELFASPHHHELEGFINSYNENVLTRVQGFLSHSMIKKVFLVEFQDEKPPVTELPWIDPTRYAKSIMKHVRSGRYSYILTEKDDKFVYIWLLSQEVFNAFCRDKYFLEKLYAKEIHTCPTEEDAGDTIVVDKSGKLLLKSASKKLSKQPEKI